MAEELRIIVVDEGGTAGQAPPPPQAPPPQAPQAPQATPQAPQPQQPQERPRAAQVVQREQQVRARVESGIGVAQAVAGGNVGAVARSALAAITGPVGIAAVALAGSLGIAAVAARSFARMVESQVNQLQGLSADVTLAAVESQLRQYEALRSRAEQIGPELARAERLRSRFEEAMTNIGTEVLEILLRILNEIEPAMQLVIKVLNWVAEFLDKYGEQLGQTIWNSLESLPLIGHIFTAIKGILKIMQLWSDEQEEEAPKDPIFEIFLETTKAARRRMDPIGEGLGG